MVRASSQHVYEPSAGVGQSLVLDKANWFWLPEWANWLIEEMQTLVRKLMPWQEEERSWVWVLIGFSSQNKFKGHLYVHHVVELLPYITVPYNVFIILGVYVEDVPLFNEDLFEKKQYDRWLERVTKETQKRQKISPIATTVCRPLLGSWNRL